MKSLFSDEKTCYICGSPHVHKHHVYFGTANRRLSESWGCWVYLCPAHHNMTKQGVHFNRQLDLELKEECQRRWEKRYGEGFTEIFGRNYL